VLQQHRCWSALALLVGSALRAQSATTVPASSAIYDRLESVSALFPARGVFLGERPLSNRQLQVIVTRLARVIDGAPPGGRRDWASRELRDISEALRPTSGRRAVAPGVTALTAWRADVTMTDALTERITPNGMGQIDAVTNPFEARRDGWPITRGEVTTIAATGAVDFRGWAALAAQPRLSMIDPQGRADGTRWIGAMPRVYARGRYRNAALRIGAEEQLWGQSSFGSLFLSGNAPPFPAIALETDTAITLPWWFRFAGPVRGTLMLADLGARQNPPHAKLAGWQVSMMPWSRFELGVAVLTQTGGSGGPKATFFERVVDLFPVIDALAPQHSDLLISNKLAGGNLRLRLPELSGLDVYYELAIDDFDARRLRSSFVHDAAHLLGARLPLLTARGQVALRAEWHRTALRIYEHGQFLSGLTYRQQILGSPLGPHAAGGYVSASWQRSASSLLDLTLADERRDPALYDVIVAGPRDSGFTFVRRTNDPDHRRARATATLAQSMPFGALRVTLGHNVAWRPGQAKRGEWLGFISLNSQRLTAF
jgi:hypothetical protein